MQQQIIDKKLKFYVIDGYKVAKETGMGGRINTIMQTCFFAISGVLPREEAIAAIKHSIEKTYGKRGEAVVQKNFAAVDSTLANLHRGEGPGDGHQHVRHAPAGAGAGARVRAEGDRATIIAGDGDDLPVSAMPVDGTFPTGTAQWEKRNIALEIPVWDEELCIQCGKCVLVCPHAVIRAKVYESDKLAGAPPTFKAVPARWKDFKDMKYTLAGGARRLHRLRPVRRGLPGQEQDARSSTRPSTWCRSRRSASRKRRTGTSSSSLPETDRSALNAEPGEGRAVAAAAVRVLRRLRGLRRDAVRQADDASCSATAHRDRQRHRLLVDLRRQPADHAVHASTRTAAARPGPTRCSKTTPSSAWACAWRSTSRRSTPASWCSGSRRRSATNWLHGLLNADQTTEAGIRDQRERVAAAEAEAGRRSNTPRAQGPAQRWPTPW